jgi:hypothetical protein
MPKSTSYSFRVISPLHSVFSKTTVSWPLLPHSRWAPHLPPAWQAILVAISQMHVPPTHARPSSCFVVPKWEIVRSWRNVNLVVHGKEIKSCQKVRRGWYICNYRRKNTKPKLRSTSYSFRVISPLHSAFLKTTVDTFFPQLMSANGIVRCSNLLLIF